MLNEEWRPIPGYEGLYAASDAGRVRSLPRVRLNGCRDNGRILKPSTSPNGYLRVLLYPSDGRPRVSRTVHQLILETFSGPRPEGMDVVRHINGEQTDNRLVNLTYGTSRENMHDRFRHGTNHQVNKTHCPSGHEYTPENTYIRPGRVGVFSAGRGCRTCRTIQARNSRLRRTWRAAQATADGAVR